MPPLAPPPQLVIPTAAAAANGFQNGQKGGNHHPQQPVLINAMAAITIASFFMTAPEYMQKLPCSLPGGLLLLKHSEEKNARRCPGWVNNCPAGLWRAGQKDLS